MSETKKRIPLIEAEKLAKQIVDRPKKFGGMLPSNLTVKDGAIWNGNKIIPTPEEEDVFDLLGIGFIVPENRQP